MKCLSSLLVLVSLCGSQLVALPPVSFLAPHHPLEEHDLLGSVGGTRVKSRNGATPVDDPAFYPVVCANTEATSPNTIEVTFSIYVEFMENTFANGTPSMAGSPMQRVGTPQGTVGIMQSIPNTRVEFDIYNVIDNLPANLDYFPASDAATNIKVIQGSANIDGIPLTTSNLTNNLGLNSRQISDCFSYSHSPTGDKISLIVGLFPQYQDYGLNRYFGYRVWSGTLELTVELETLQPIQTNGYFNAWHISPVLTSFPNQFAYTDNRQDLGPLPAIPFNLKLCTDLGGFVNLLSGLSNLTPPGRQAANNFLSEGLTATLSPNPASDMVRLSGFTNSEADLQYEVYDLAGKLVEKGNISPNQPASTVPVFEKSLHISTWPSGIYLIRLADETRMYKPMRFHKL